MGVVKERVAWTIPYQTSWVDRHELERELLRAAAVRAEGALVRVPAFRRLTPWGTEYEPAYMELLDRADEPELRLVGDLDAEEHELEEDLPGEVLVSAIVAGGFWTNVRARPRVAAIETSEDGELGLTVGYSLLDVEREEPAPYLNLASALGSRMRSVLTEGGWREEPYFYVWGGYSPYA